MVIATAPGVALRGTPVDCAQCGHEVTPVVGTFPDNTAVGTLSGRWREFWIVPAHRAYGHGVCTGSGRPLGPVVR
ncbi:hypothetical protein MORGUSHI_86 [Mycobacterium phage Morgushi]|uniref:Uncharacterized protein n=1 Tax=Mycobacterium phage Morgushi TaxID=1084721 RepID=G3MCB5_9CAUD|nr:hypothetical protein MORGUSHI_86 [Mycobacterium phage Morgushi]